MSSECVPIDDCLGLVVDRIWIAVGTNVEGRSLATRALRLDRQLAHLGRQRILEQPKRLELIVRGVDLHDTKVARIAIDDDAGMLALGVGRLAIRRTKRLFEGYQQDLRVDRLLLF